jgi:hypothetical protein
MAYRLEFALNEALDRLIKIRRGEVQTRAAIALKFFIPKLPLLNYLTNTISRLNLPRRRR